MKHKAFALVEAIVVVVILAILAALLFPVFARSRENDGYRSPESRCTSNLKQLGLGIAQYVQDYDEKFPPTKNATGGWADLVFPYVKSTQIFQCPSDQNRADKTTDYFFNARLSGVAMKKIPSPNLTLALGDGASDQPLDAHLSQLPDAWRSDSNSPAFRHLDGANYAFVDGHVKWFKPQNITLDKPSALKPTFLIGSFQS